MHFRPLLPRTIRGFSFFALSGLLALAFAGCAETKVQKTWTAPQTGELHFTKLFVFAIAKDDTNWRLAEIAMRNAIESVPAVSSHELLPDIVDVGNRTKLFQAIKESGADGLVVMQLKNTDVNITTTGPSSRPMDYMVFSDYYGSVYDVGAYYATDKRTYNADSIYGVETRIFDIKTQKLLWSGQTESIKTLTKSQDVEAIVTEIANTLRSQLKSQGLIP